MKILSNLVAIAALTISLSAVPALAEGKKLKTIWNPENAAQSLQSGFRVCEGSKEQHQCAIFFALTEEIQLQTVSRPAGLNKNLVSNAVVAADKTGYFVRKDGQLVPRIAVNSESSNAASIWTQGAANVLSSAANGAVSSIVQAVANPCGNGGCQGTSIITVVDTVVEGSQALAQSGSTANANVASSACGGSPCAPLPRSN